MDRFTLRFWLDALSVWCSSFWFDKGFEIFKSDGWHFRLIFSFGYYCLRTRSLFIFYFLDTSFHCMYVYCAHVCMCTNGFWWVPNTMATKICNFAHIIKFNSRFIELVRLVDYLGINRHSVWMDLVLCWLRLTLHQKYNL